jgi:hypothetical protein
MKVNILPEPRSILRRFSPKGDIGYNNAAMKEDTGRGEDYRHFRRYKTFASFVIHHDGREYIADVTDFSATGLGIIIEGSPPIKASDSIDLDVPTVGVEEKGAVAWTRQTDDGLMAGVRLDGHIYGNFKLHWLPDILTGLKRAEKTGMLEVTSEDIRKEAFIKRGDLVFASSNHPDDQLGDILLKEGVITRKQYDNLVEMTEITMKKDGALLVELGFMKPQGLVQTVKRQVEEIVVSLFRFSEGGFRFIEGAFPENDVVSLKIPVAAIIHKGMKAKGKGMFRNIGLLPDLVLRHSSDPYNLTQEADLDESDKMILSHVDGKKTIKEIIALLPYGESAVLADMRALLATRVLDIEDQNI